MKGRIYVWMLPILWASHVLSFTILPKHDGSIRKPFLLHSSSHPAITIALTREEGNNDKLKKELTSLLLLNKNDDDASPTTEEPTTIVELPCIAHADGEDLPRLEETLRQGTFDYIVVTSPEAARVLATAYLAVTNTHNNDGDDDRSDPSTALAASKVAAVGKATRETLEKLGIPVDFCPTKATAQTLVQELPATSVQQDNNDRPATVLYPASARAATTLQDGLEASKRFVVTRLNTYDTMTAVWTDEQKDLASHVTVVCFGSPSAVEAWLLNSNNNRNVLAACIGETSAAACREFQFPEENIFFPEKPGIPGWAQAVNDALQRLSAAQEHNISVLK
ncbi:Uroporphyrinogen-III synthase HemD [Fragilaria crotonensis]|nr:Uroporphyrinogen-III synthase HemD [Fragilaria crotonensis]